MHLATARHGTDALKTLAHLVATAKAGNPLTPVAIVVRDNIAAISVRRALASGVGGLRGVAAINVTTLRRLAEQLIAAAGETRPPVSSALLTALWRRELGAEPGSFESVVEHPATVRAVVRAHRELRELERAELDAVASWSLLTADMVRLHGAVASHVLSERRDEVAVLQDAAIRVRAAGIPAELGAILLHLPEELSPTSLEFLRSLDAASELTVLLGLTGHGDIDGALMETLAAESGVPDPFAGSTTGDTDAPTYSRGRRWGPIDGRADQSERER